METTLYKNNFQNCFQLVVSSMLSRQRVPVEYIWNQAGLYISDEQAKWYLTPYYWNLRSYLKTIGIQYFESNVDDTTLILETIQEILSKRLSVGVMVDIFELPYSMYYQEYHDSHTVEIVGIDGTEFEIFDHYYRYQGKIELSQLCRAINSYFEHFPPDNYLLFYLDATNFSEMLIDTELIISNNMMVMKGNAIRDYIDKKANQIVGLDAIPVLKNKVLSLLRLNEEDAEPHLDNMFKDIKEISFSRYNFFIFLKKLTVVDFFEYLEEASQGWGVTANMILRAKVTGEYESMSLRISNRFDRLLEQERKINEIILKYIQGNKEVSDYA
ncbi:hypothetical protein A616_28845 [Brevibacillus brevis X23]|nr:hypothetical protein A616_28845 [Brevibacillus brevis X23]